MNKNKKLKINTRDMEGSKVVCSKGGKRYEGILLRFYPSTKAVMLSDYELYRFDEEGREWSKQEEGKLTMIKDYGYDDIRAKSIPKKFRKKVHKIKARRSHLG